MLNADFVNFSEIFFSSWNYEIEKLLGDRKITKSN